MEDFEDASGGSLVGNYNWNGNANVPLGKRLESLGSAKEPLGKRLEGLGSTRVPLEKRCEGLGYENISVQAFGESQ
jgi:hypothetical protein